MNSWLLLLVTMVVVLIVFVAVLPLFDEFTELATHFDTTTTMLIKAMVLLIALAIVGAMFRKFDNDLNRETY